MENVIKVKYGLKCFIIRLNMHKANNFSRKSLIVCGEL